jgi:hypothetical protein
MSEMVQITIISGCFALLSIVGLALSYRYKLKLTLEANEWERQKTLDQRKQEIKLAKIRNPNYKKMKRMPKGFKDQIQDFLYLMGDERVQGLIEMFTERSEEIPEDNRLISAFMSLAEGFLQGKEQTPQLEEHVQQNY